MTHLRVLSMMMVAAVLVGAQDLGSVGKKSAKHPSMLRSAIIPGWGEASLGDRVTARRFFLSDAGLWAAMAAAVSQERSLEARFQSIAALHAGVSPVGKNEEYFLDIGNHKSLDAYNDYQQRIRNPGAVYPRGMGYEWEWDRQENQQRFRRARIGRDQTAKAARFLAGGLVVNRVLSVIHVNYLSRKGELSATVIPVISSGGYEPRVAVTLEW